MSASLRLDEDIDIIYTAKVPEGATALMTFTMNGSSVTVEDDGAHIFTLEDVNPQCIGDNICAVLTVTLGEDEHSCIKATEFDDTVTASFKLNGESIGRTAFYSVNTYICGTQDCANENLAALVQALYNYGASAKDYAE